MSIKIPTKYIIVAVFVAVLALMGAGYVIGHHKADRLIESLKQAQNDTIQKYKIKLNEQTLFVYAKLQEIESQRQAISDGDIQRKELKALNLKVVNENTRLKLQVDTLINIPHTGKIDTIIVAGRPQHVLYLPYSFEKKDTWLSLRGTFNQIGDLGLSIKMDAGLDIWCGIDKDTKLPTAKITTSNPYLQTISINSIKLDTPKPKKFGIGVFGGYGINVNSTVKGGWIIGAGIDYNLFSF